MAKAVKTEAWGSRVGLILAMAGNAVGLGNFLRFPVQALQNGGGAFIIPYLVCFLLMGIPLLWVEWSSGRFGGSRGHHSTPFILQSMDRRQFWKYVGVFGIFTNLAVAAYYCYLESWALGWVWYSATGTFSGLDQAGVSGFFGNYVGLSGNEPIVFWIICLALNTWILSRGLSGGIEKAAKIGMPLLLLFGVVLAIQAVSIKGGENGALFDGTEGLNFLWTPDYSSIWSGEVWMAAAGQIFFTLSLGMGSIQCYASYMKKKDDIALNAVSAGFMNGFVEIVLGASVLIPIAVGYLGIDKVVEMTKEGGLGLGFTTLPYLFEQWGPVMAVIAGVMWFGLLFFAGVTSSLAMGTPVMGFLQDEFGFKRTNSAITFGLAVFLMGLPTVYFFNYGVFDEYDYWAGTFSLVVFALFEIILFSWIFGLRPRREGESTWSWITNLDVGWKEITTGADIKIPVIFKFIIKWITPALLIAVFVYNLDGLWDKITNAKIYEAMKNATTTKEISDLKDKIWYVNISRIFLLGVFVFISRLVYIAYKRRLKNGRII